MDFAEDTQSSCDLFRDNWGSNPTPSDCPDWRRQQRRPQPLPDSVSVADVPPPAAPLYLFSRRCHRPREETNKRRTASQASARLRFCPGDLCKLYLPEFQFGANSTMPSGFDTYCIACNNHRRSTEKQAPPETKHPSPRGGFTANHVFDRREEIRSGVALSSSALTRKEVVEEIRSHLSREFTKVPFRLPFSAEMVYEKLFSGRRLICDASQKPLTPRCFLDHHSLRINTADGQVVLKCTHTSEPIV